MPEMTFEVRWPDGSTQRCYSPSLVIHDHLTAGTHYAVDDFVERSSRALAEASERVRAKYGFACTSAAETRQRIVNVARRFSGDAVLEVVAMHAEPGPS